MLWSVLETTGVLNITFVVFCFSRRRSADVQPTQDELSQQFQADWRGAQGAPEFVQRVYPPRRHQGPLRRGWPDPGDGPRAARNRHGRWSPALHARAGVVCYRRAGEEWCKCKQQRAERRRGRGREGEQGFAGNRDLEGMFVYWRVSFSYLKLKLLRLGCSVYPPIAHYWTGLLILDHSYLVENLTNSKIAETKALEALKSWNFCLSNFWTS